MRDLKKFQEQRNQKVKRMQEILGTAETEERALNEEEQQEFDALEKEVQGIDKTITAEKRAEALSNTHQEGDGGTESDEITEEQKQEEERAFAEHIRGKVRGEERADSNMTFGDNGVIIPQSIAKKIISRVEDICPIYNSAEHYNIKGKLTIPYIDVEGSNLMMSYADEFTELESTAMKTKGIDLNGFLAGVLAKISKSLVNNSDFDVVAKVIEELAKAVSRWIENEILNGTEGKITGMSSLETTMEAGAATVITMDDLVKTKGKLKAVFQKNAYWIMHPDTLTAIRLLKDKNERYYVLDDPTNDFGVSLLGKPVYTSDNMPTIEAGSTPVLYGDYGQALAVKIAEEMEIQVLNEKYATQHAVGVVGWCEIDAKVQNQQAAIKLKMATA